MVKRRKEEDFAGVLEFEGLTSGDPELKDWLAHFIHRIAGIQQRVSRKDAL